MKQKNSVFKGLMLVSILIVFSSIVNAQVTAEFTNDPTLYFTGSSSDPSTLYQDAIDGNLDVGIELCNIGQRYVGGTYAIQIGSTWNYALVTYSSSTNALAFTSNDEGGGCYSVSAGFLTVSPSTLTTPDPDVFKAGLPGNLFIAYEASANPGTLSNFVYGNASAKLLGSYTATRSFDESTRQITVQNPQISFQTSSGSFTKSASDASFGINADRQLAIGVCDNNYGVSCDAGELLTSNTFPNSYTSGLTAGQVNDQNIHTKYVVMNGLGYPMCIGANLQGSVTVVSPDPVYYSQTLEINFTVSNPRNTPYETTGGNVQVSTPFDVDLTIYNASNPGQIIYSDTIAVGSTISPGGSLTITENWPAYARSGTYTVRIDVDSGSDISECNEADNSATRNFILKPITIPQIFIDGVETDVFPYPNVPYNLSFHMKNSDNATLDNATVNMIETNGLSLTLPTQVYNISTGSGNTSERSGVVTKTTMTFITDYDGNASFTFIPTYNKLYQPQYNYTNLDLHIGNYSLNFTGTQKDGEAFKFVRTGTLYSEYDLSINNVSYSGSYANKDLLHETTVSQVMDFVYQTFTNFLETVLD